MTTLLFQMCAAAPGWQDAEDPAPGFVRARQALYQLARESPALSAVRCAVSTPLTLPRDSRELALLGFPINPNFLMAWDLGTLNFNILLKLRVLLPPTSQPALGEPWRAGPPGLVLFQALSSDSPLRPRDSRLCTQPPLS